MRGLFKLAFGIGMLSLVSFAAPACGGDDDSGGSGGTAATGGGGSGGTGGSEGGQCLNEMACGANQCCGWKLGGLLPMKPCCVGGGDTCGADIDATLAPLVGFPVGCYEPNQPGVVDCGCPSLVFTNPIDQSQAQFNGCCSTSGECGYAADTSSEGGPDFGCIPLTKLGATTAVPCTVGSETPLPSGSDYCETDAGTGGAAGAGGAAGGGGMAGSSSGGTAGASDAGSD